MSPSTITPRYEAAQIADAIGLARGDGRYFLVKALMDYPGTGSEREDALARVLDMELRPDERHFALLALARIRPVAYLRPLIETSLLRSRSLNVQQMAVSVLPDLAGDRLDPDLAAEVEGWLRRRMTSRSRENNYATSEIPSAALALLPLYGFAQVLDLLESLEPRMQPEERRHWNELSSATNVQDLAVGLRSWSTENSAPFHAPSDPPDPTADIAVDRVMKRLGYKPSNPASPTYDPLEDWEPLTIEFPWAEKTDCDVHHPAVAGPGLCRHAPPDVLIW